jgi:hypothetical protein
MYSVIPVKLKRRSSTFSENNPKVGVGETELFNFYDAVNNDGFVYYYQDRKTGNYMKLHEAEVSTIIAYMKKHKGFRDNLLREINMEFSPSELKEWETESEQATKLQF